MGDNVPNFSFRVLVSVARGRVHRVLLHIPGTQKTLNIMFTIIVVGIISLGP